MSLPAQPVASARIHIRYWRACRPHRTRILDEFCSPSGYHRKAALRLLNRPLPTAPPKRSGPKLLCDPQGFCRCSKPSGWPSLVVQQAAPGGAARMARTSRSAHAPLPEAFRKLLLKISLAQIDHLLLPARVQHFKNGISTTRRCPADTSRPSPSRPIRWRIAMTARRAITSIRSRLPSFTAGGRKTAPSASRAPRACSRN